MHVALSRLPPPSPFGVRRRRFLFVFSLAPAYRYSLVLHVILSPVGIGNLTYYVPVMDAGDDLAQGGGGGAQVVAA